MATFKDFFPPFDLIDMKWFLLWSQFALSVCSFCYKEMPEVGCLRRERGVFSSLLGRFDDVMLALVQLWWGPSLLSHITAEAVVWERSHTSPKPGRLGGGVQTQAFIIIFSKWHSLLETNVPLQVQLLHWPKDLLLGPLWKVCNTSTQPQCDQVSSM